MTVILHENLMMRYSILMNNLYNRGVTIVSALLKIEINHIVLITTLKKNKIYHCEIEKK